MTIKDIGAKIKVARKPWGQALRKPKEDEARDILATVILSHVAVKRFNFRLKVCFFGSMLLVRYL